MKKTLSALFLLALAWLFAGVPSVKAQSATPAPAVVTITVLDKDGKPLAGVRLALELVRYGATVEYLDGGTCTTDQAGQCVFDLADVPRLNDGSAEAVLTVGDFGRQPLGWKGDQADFVIQASDVGLAATLRAPLDDEYEGQTQAPTDAPPPTLAPTNTPTPTPLVTNTPVPTDTPLPTATPTATLEPAPTPTPAPAGLAWPGILPVALAGCGLVVLWVVIVLAARTRRRK